MPARNPYTQAKINLLMKLRNGGVRLSELEPKERKLAEGMAKRGNLKMTRIPSGDWLVER